MTRLQWGNIVDRTYETGVDRGVLYPEVGPGLAWNGLVAVNELSGDISRVRAYFEGVPSVNKVLTGSFEADVEAFTYPIEFEDDIFGFSYRTKVNEDHYRIHLVYNAIFSPKMVDYGTLTVNSDISTMRWTLTTRPVFLESSQVSRLIIDSRHAQVDSFNDIQDILYGTEDTLPRFPSADEVLEIFESNTVLRIIDHGDGTWTAIGPDDVVYLIDNGVFEIDWVSAVYIDEVTYRISSF